MKSLSFFIAIPNWIFKFYTGSALALAFVSFLALPLYYIFGFSFYFDTKTLFDASNYFINSYSLRVGTPVIIGTSILALSGFLSAFTSALILRIILKSSRDLFFIAGLLLTISSSILENFFLPFTFAYFVPVIFLSNLFEAFRMNSLVNQELLIERKKIILNADTNESDKYQNSSLTEERLKVLADKITHVLSEDQIYLNPNLNSEGLAKAVGLPTYQLSQVVNIGLDTTFFDLLNFYRIKEVKRKLNDKTLLNETIINIAYDSGFNSKSTFNTTFKKQTGTTPSAFRKRLKNPVTHQ